MYKRMCIQKKNMYILFYKEHVFGIMEIKSLCFLTNGVEKPIGVKKEI